LYRSGLQTKAIMWRMGVQPFLPPGAPGLRKKTR